MPPPLIFEKGGLPPLIEGGQGGQAVGGLGAEGWGGMGGEGDRRKKKGEELKRAAGARSLKLGHAEGVYRMCQAREGCSGGGFPIGKSLLGGHYFQNFRACGAPFNRKYNLP